MAKGQNQSLSGDVPLQPGPMADTAMPHYDKARSQELLPAQQHDRAV